MGLCCFQTVNPAINGWAIVAFQASRRAEAVEAAGIIRPLWIAEIGRAVREGGGLQWLPDGIGKIGGGFYHDDQIAAARDVEAKLPRLHTELAIAGLRLRVP